MIWESESEKKSPWVSEDSRGGEIWFIFIFMLIEMPDGDPNILIWSRLDTLYRVNQ